MTILGSLKRVLGSSSSRDPHSDQIAELRDEMVDRATRHEVLAAQRTDLVVDQLWRRLEDADARLATALQRIEERVSRLEEERHASQDANGASSSGSSGLHAE